MGEEARRGQSRVASPGDGWRKAERVPQELGQAIVALAVACAQAGLNQEPLGAREEEAIATMERWPPPLNALPAFLRALSRREVPTVPPCLPGPLADALGQLLAAIREA